MIEKERGEKEQEFFFRNEKEEEERKKMLKKKEGQEERRKYKEEGEKEREKVFREVMCGKVVGPCMGKGNVKKNVKRYNFNKRECIIDNLM